MSRYGSFWVDTAREDQPLFDRRLAARILAFARPVRGWLILAAVSAPLLSGLQLVRPYLLKLAVDDAILVGDHARLALYGALFFGLLLVETGGFYGQLFLLQYIGQVVLRGLRDAVFAKLLALDHRFYHRHPTGVLLTRVTSDVEAIQELFASGIVTLVTDVLKLLGIMAVMLWLHWRLALVVFAVLPVLYLVSDLFRRRLRRAYRRVRTALGELNGRLTATIDAIEEVQAQHLEPEVATRFDEANARYRRANLDSILQDALLYASVEMIGSVTIAALIAFGASRYLEREGVTLGMLVAMIEYVQMFFVPIRDLSAKYAVLQSAFASAEKVFGVLDEPVSVRSPREPRTGPLRGEAAAQAVTFAYEPGSPVLCGLDLEVSSRGFVALVGPTGHGKSTVLRLLRRFYDVDGGRVTVDGVDVRAWSLPALRRRTLAVEQRVFLFSGTVADNLALADELPRADLVQAVAAVGLGGDDPEVFLDLELEEEGRNLSMGERQLLALARVLARDPEFLLLDEATAHVDSATEEALYRVLRQEHGRRTVVVVAHRLSTVRDADRIYVIRHGRVVERGTHAELVARGGVYAQLVRLDELERRALLE